MAQLAPPLTAALASAFQGQSVTKTFPGTGTFKGVIDNVDTTQQPYWYHIVYSDGDDEHLGERILGMERKQCAPPFK